MEKKDKVAQILKDVNYPGFSRDIISFGLVKDVSVSEDSVVISFCLL